MILLNLLVTILLLGFVFWLLSWAIDNVPAPDPFKAMARLILVLAIVIVVLEFLFGGLPAPRVLLLW